MTKAIRPDRRHERSWTEWNVPWELGEITGGNWSIKTMDQFHLEITRCTRNSFHTENRIPWDRNVNFGKTGRALDSPLINIDFTIQMATR